MYQKVFECFFWNRYNTLHNNCRKMNLKEIYTLGNKIYLVLVLHRICVEFKGALYKTDYSLNFFLHPDLVDFNTGYYMNKFCSQG